MKIGYTPGTGWPASLAGTTTIPRRHLYEWGFPGELDYRGFDAAILTNSSGACVSGDVTPGRVYWIMDHINLTGDTPLSGPDFLDCHDIYSQGLPGLGVVYAQVRGPQYETPAEARMLARLGADVVGMSTAIEAIAAHKAGCKVYGLTFVSNVAGARSNHEEVLASAALAAPRMEAALAGVMDQVQRNLR